MQSTESSRRITLTVIASLVGIVAGVLAIEHWVVNDGSDIVQSLRPPAAAAERQQNHHPCPPTDLDSRQQVAVRLEVERPDEHCAWSTELTTTKPGAAVAYLITYKNTSRKVQNHVIFRTNLAPGMAVVPHSVRLRDSLHLNDPEVEDGIITQGGVDLGNFAPGADGYLTFRATLPVRQDLDCGWNSYTTVGVAHPEALDEFYNMATVKAYRSCQ